MDGVSRRSALAGLAVVVAGISVVFLSLVSAFVWRQESAWTAAPLPRILWVNTAVLIGSSALLEAARRELKSGHRSRFNLLWTAGTACGILFLLGQGLAWRQVREEGFKPEGNPGAAFFYLAAATHAAHILAGLAALVWVDVAALRFELGPGKRTGAEVSALFWHFLDAVWVGLMALLALWA